MKWLVAAGAVNDPALYPQYFGKDAIRPGVIADEAGGRRIQIGQNSQDVIPEATVRFGRAGGRREDRVEVVGNAEMRGPMTSVLVVGSNVDGLARSAEAFQKYQRIVEQSRLVVPVNGLFKLALKRMRPAHRIKQFVQNGLSVPVYIGPFLGMEDSLSKAFSVTF